MAVSSGAAPCGHFGQSFPGQMFERGILEPDQQHALGRAGRQEQVLPLVGRCAHFLGDAAPCFGIAHAGDPFCQSAFLHPRRHRAVEPGRSGRVQVHVGRDAHAGCPGGFDELHDPLTLGPILPASGLEMINLGRQSGLTGDRDQLLDPFDQAVALAAHVRDVHALILGRHLAQFDELVRIGVKGRLWRKTN
jgi:hypothetical protein